VAPRIATLAVVVALLAVGLVAVVLPRGPETPTALTASPRDGSSITISWTPVDGGATIDRYLILRDGMEVGSVAAPEQSFTDSGLTPAQTYRYRVVAESGSDRSAASVEQSARSMAPSPGALKVVKRTTTSIVLAWNPPASAPAPDQYLISQNGAPPRVVTGQTRFADRKLIPATGYRYTVAAKWGSRTSEASEPSTAKTKTPSLAAARLDGSMAIRTEVTGRPSGSTWPEVGKKWTTLWFFRPKCDSGPCNVVASVQIDTDTAPFTVTLTRQGKNYSGSTVEPLSTCRGTPLRDTVTVRVRVTKAAIMGGEWTASAVAGTLTVLSPYQSVGGGWYCPTQTYSTSVSSR
jgi:hypothetical protein